jgi:Integrase core domain
VVGRRGSPTRIQSDNGSELIGEALTSWWKEVGSEPIPVEAGNHWQNGFIESFHSRLRDEFLERVEFESVKDAQAKATWFRREYNTIRPNSSIGYKTPREFNEECDQNNQMNNIKSLNINNNLNNLLKFPLEWTKKRRATQSRIHWAAASTSSISTAWPAKFPSTPTWTRP